MIQRSALLIMIEVYFFLFLLSGISCAKDQGKTFEDQFITKLLSEIVKCTPIDSFQNEALDSLPFKLQEYDELLSECFYPLIGESSDKELTHLKQKYNVSRSDIGYFILCKIHDELNGKKKRLGMH